MQCNYLKQVQWQHKLKMPGTTVKGIASSCSKVQNRAGAGTGRVALGGGTVRSPGTPQIIIRGTDQ